MYRERVNEKLPTEYLLHEFDELISCKSLGSYNCCEMVSIYLCQREKEMPDNVYTIFVFETRPNVEKSSERLLKKLKSITDTYSLLMPYEVFRKNFFAHMNELEITPGKVRLDEAIRLIVCQMSDFLVPYVISIN